jgi:outer membrane protein assembly factor BamB
MRIGALLLLTALAAYAENWPGFRGPTRQGISSERKLPVAFKQPGWTTPLPGEAWSSPIVWGDRIFVTTATDEGKSCRVLGLDRNSGKILWDRHVFDQVLKRKEKKNSYATPTPVTDGKLVYAVFGDGSFAALDFNGSVVWTNREFPHYSQHGLGASPILHGDLLIMARDPSSEGDDRKVGWKIPWDQAVILALEKSTGKVRWKGKRGLSRIAHVTPNVLTGSGAPQLISGAGDVVQGFDLKTGERIWTAYSQGEGVVPSIVIGDDLIYTVSGFEKPTIRAYKPGGRGDVTSTHLAWEQTKGVPMISSLLYMRPHLYSVTTGGVAFCFDAKTGEIVWQGRVDGSHSASPVFADGNIYFSSEEGDVTAIAAGPEFRVTGKSHLGEMIQASPAISQGRIYIRTQAAIHAIAR